MTLLKCLTALVLAVSTVTVAPQIADACGGSYGIDLTPTVHLVSSHHTPRGPRAFVALGETDVKVADSEWSRLWPSSYDYSAISQYKYAGTRTFTLVGPSGTRVVKTSNRQLLAQTFTLGFTTQQTTEVKVGKDDDFEIAIEGERAATWFELDALGLTTKMHYDSANGPQFDLYRGDTSLGTFSGRPLGAVTIGSQTFLVAQTKGDATAHWIL